jgi:hypothetical protein
MRVRHRRHEDGTFRRPARFFTRRMLPRRHNARPRSAMA